MMMQHTYISVFFQFLTELLLANSSTATNILKIKAAMEISASITVYSTKATAMTLWRYVSRSPHIK